MINSTLLDSKKRLDGINQSSLAIPKFEDRHRRITLYLENEVYADLQLLRAPGKSQSAIVNQALRDYMILSHIINES